MMQEHEKPTKQPGGLLKVQITNSFSWITPVHRATGKNMHPMFDTCLAESLPFKVSLLLVVLYFFPADNSISL